MRFRGVAIACAALVAGLGELYARAGGGEGFGGGGGGSGGGGFSSSGGGGGDGNGWLIYVLIRLCIERPLIGIPLVIVILWIMYAGGQKGVKQGQVIHQGSVIRKGRAVQTRRLHGIALANLRQRDPGFDEQAFCRRVRTAFLKIQQAWCAQDLRDVRAFISDAVDERFSLQIREQQDEGWRDQMEDIRTRQIRIVQIQSNPVYDVITVQIDCSAVNYRVDRRTGQKIAGSNVPEEFTEYWSFLRRPDAKTIASGGLIEGQCPNCGSALQLNEAAQCGSCLSLVESGVYDWVLVEITQASEWVIRDEIAYPGLPEMTAKDPAFSFQALEDRASVMFWRLMATFRSGTTDPIRKMATDAFAERIAGELRVEPGADRQYPGECAVGGVESLGVIPGEEVDRALVKVRWSASMFRQTAKGKRIREGAKALHTDILVLARAGHVRTDVQRGLQASHCPSCGGSVSSSAANSCEYCGKVINDGSLEWVLEDRGGPHDPHITAWMDQLAQWSTATAGIVVTDAAPGMAAQRSHSGMALAAWLIHVMMADGAVDPKEERTLRAYARKVGLSTGQLDSLIEAAKRGMLEQESPEDPEQIRTWLNEMAVMGLADGRISKEETQSLHLLGGKLGYAPADISMLINRARSTLYQQSKAAIREGG